MTQRRRITIIYVVATLPRSVPVSPCWLVRTLWGCIAAWQTIVGPSSRWITGVGIVHQHFALTFVPGCRVWRKGGWRKGGWSMVNGGCDVKSVVQLAGQCGAGMVCLVHALCLDICAGM